MKKSEIQGRLWGRSPDGWAEIQEQLHRPLWEAMLDVTKVSAETKFLDVGCGAGGASILARARGAEVHGIDVAEPLLSIASQRVPDGSFQVCDIEQLPFADGTFDVIFAANSLQYAEDHLAALQELKRVCKPEGQIVAGLFGVPEKVAFKSIFKAVRDTLPEPPKGSGPFEFSILGKLEGLFAAANLQHITTGEINCPFEYANFESFWYGNASAGPFQGALQQVSEEKLKSAVKEATKEFLQDDGCILIKTNVFKYVSASR